MVSGGTRTAVAAAGGLALTAIVAGVPSLFFSYPSPVGRAVLETTVTLVGSLVAVLCLGRYRRDHNPADLAIALAMALLALAYPLLSALPQALFGPAAGPFAAWAPLGARLAAGGLLVVAGSLRWARAAPRSPPWALLAAPVAAVAVGLPLLVLTLAPGGQPLVANQVNPLADPLVAATQGVAALLFALAAVLFSRAAGRGRDPLLGWLGVAAALASVASLHYALVPSLAPTWLHTGDVFRAGAIAAAAVGAVAEIRSYWAQTARLAREEERRRLAFDLHDGLAQDLSFLVSHAQRPAASSAPEVWRTQLRDTAERALAESRLAIATLAADTAPRVGDDLARVAREVAERTGAQVAVEVVETQLATGQQEELVRIVREALANATRHGRARHVTVTLAGEPRRQLRVSDDGVGFDATAGRAAGSGLGLVSMRERARSLGADLRVRSTPGAGTVVEVTWP